MTKLAYIILSALALILVGCSVSPAPAASDNLTAQALSGTVVTEANLDVDWFILDQRGDGSLAFVNGPATPPLNNGSLQMSVLTGADKIRLLTDRHVGTLLSELEGLTYSTYRDSSSTAANIVPSINMEIDFNGAEEGGFATLVWEPLYAYGAGAINNDTWQLWDTFAPSQATFAGGWWSTRDFGDIDAFNDFVSWETIMDNVSEDAFMGRVGVNLGTGPAGSFLGNVDALALDFTGGETVYNFETIADISKEECKDGGWQTFTEPEFRNQGDCVSYFASGGKTHGKP